jgi:hypothetical protein
MSAGYTLVELLVSMTITAVIVGAMLGLFAPSHGIHAAQPEIADLHQRLRVAVESLRRDLGMAGAGLGAAIPGVIPIGAEAITVLYVPHTTAEAVVRNSTTAGAELQVNMEFNCGPATLTGLCGFDEGMRVIAFDAFGTWDALTVARVDPSSLVLRHAGSVHVYGERARVGRVERQTYYVDTDRVTRIRQLRQDDGFASDVPLVDNIVSLRFEYFGEGQPPRLLEGVDLFDATVDGPATTYGPRPPPAGSNCILEFAGGSHVSRLPVLSPGAASDIPLPVSTFSDGPWCPDALAVDRYDADLLRIRRVRVTLRIEPATATLRSVVRDQEVRFDVAPRNVRGGR